MKKYLYILACIVCAGCTQDEILDLDQEFRLMFQPGMYMHVSSTGVEDFSLDQTLGVCAWQLPEAKDSVTDLAGATLYLDVAEAHSEMMVEKPVPQSTHDVFWVVGDDAWQVDSKPVAFMAYAPYQMPCQCDVTNGITCKVDLQKDQADLLYTDPETFKQQTTLGWMVPLTFKHALAQIQFRVCHRVTLAEKIIVKGISIDSIKHQGDFASLRNPQWVLSDHTAPLIYFHDEHTVGQIARRVGNGQLIIPQKLDSRVKVEYDYVTADGNSVPMVTYLDRKLTTQLKPGNTYIYTLSISRDDVKFQLENIEHHFKTTD